MGIDIRLKGLKVVDGTGSQPFSADIAISDDKIVAVGKSPSPAAREMDFSGLTAAPGFVDVHSHSDFTLPINPRAESKIRQGVTTEIIGNCGDSAFPLIGDAMEEAKRTTETFGYQPDWISMGEYFSRLRSRLAVNLVSLIGLGTLRAATVGVGRRELSERELTEMVSFMQKTLADGARGISSGLIYPPSCWADEEELVYLSRSMGRRGIYASHIRYEGDRLLEAVEEAVSIGRRAGVSVELSHHKAAGRKNWGKTEQSLALLSEARLNGIDVNCDVYPYTASSFSLRSMFPLWAREGSPDRFLKSLKHPDTREKIRAAMEEDRAGGPLEVAGWDKTVVSSVRSDESRACQGKSVRQIAEEWGMSPFDAACELLLKEKGMVGVVRFAMAEEDIERILRNELSMIGSDAAAYSPEGVLGKLQPHPRSYGTFPRILGEYVRERGVLPLERAIHKMTGLPAKKFGLRNRGLLKEGYFADIVVFDAQSVADRSSYDDPHVFPEGIHLVVVNGRIVVEGNEMTRERPGRILRGFRKAESLVD